MKKFFAILMILGICLSATGGAVVLAGNGQATCPSGNGWTKIDSNDLSSYPVAGATDYCFKAGSSNSNGCVGGLFDTWPQPAGTCGLSHWSYYIPDVEPTEENTPVVDPTLEGTPEETPVVDQTPESTPENTPVVDPTLEGTPEETPVVDQTPVIPPVDPPPADPTVVPDPCKNPGLAQWKGSATNQDGTPFSGILYFNTADGGEQKIPLANGEKNWELGVPWTSQFRIKGAIDQQGQWHEMQLVNGTNPVQFTDCLGASSSYVVLPIGATPVPDKGSGDGGAPGGVPLGVLLFLAGAFFMVAGGLGLRFA